LAQVTELQTALNERVMAAPHRRVAAFHAMIGAPVNHTPAVPPDDRLRLRLRLIAEEFFELLDAAVSSCHGAAWLIYRSRKALFEVIDLGALDVDLPAFVDALADIDYVVEGTRLEFGVHGPPIAALVHEANMAKAGGPVDAHGKHGKPPGWKPPDIADELRRQGWAVPLVHCLDNGNALCGRQGPPRVWQPWEKSVPVEVPDKTNCPECLRVLAESKRQAPVSP
jgi:predicted HAD superfamily Cof-like phosphohydrolase